MVRKRSPTELIERLVADLNASWQRVSALRPDDYPHTTDRKAVDAYLEASEECRRLQTRLWNGPENQLEELSRGRGKREVIEYGIAYLELAPYYFRSGYTRNRAARGLARAPMDEWQRARARKIVLDWVGGATHGASRDFGRLARSCANNELRRTLRNRLDDPDPKIAARSLVILLEHIRRPGLSAQTLRIRPEVFEHLVSSYGMPRNSLRRIVRRYWSPERETELLELAHAKERVAAAADQLLREAEYRQARRGERRPGP